MRPSPHLADTCRHSRRPSKTIAIYHACAKNREGEKNEGLETQYFDSLSLVEKHVRLLADVSGDGRKDIVAFGNCRLHNESTVARLAARECYLETPLIVVTTGRERKNKRGR
jgi:hypothetical protein